MSPPSLIFNTPHTKCWHFEKNKNPNVNTWKRFLIFFFRLKAFFSCHAVYFELKRLCHENANYGSNIFIHNLHFWECFKCILNFYKWIRKKY